MQEKCIQQWFVPSMREELSLIKENRYYRLMVYQLLVSVLHVKGCSVLLISGEEKTEVVNSTPESTPF